MSDVPGLTTEANPAKSLADAPVVAGASPPQDGRARRYRDNEDRARRLKAQGMCILTILTGLGYLAWIVFAMNPEHRILGIGFLMAEAACLTLFACASSTMWHLRFKPQASPKPERDYAVDVFVPCCGEPIEVISKTLHACKAIEWNGPVRVYVLDDGGSEELRALTESLGFAYRSRKLEGVERRDAKAGNLNFGLTCCSGELLLVLDADQVPHANILQALAGYMRFPRVAFVQSRQSYLVPEGDPFFNEDRVFYGAVQLAMDSHDTVIACGSAVLYRREALDDIGGFAIWNLVEDLTTSYHLHARGWKSFYYPYPLSDGLAPDDIWGVMKQRGQWALDTMRLFFWDNPLVKKGLPARKRLNYFLIGFTYLTCGIFIPFLFLIPPWVYLTGSSVIIRPEFEFALVRAFYFCSMIGAMRYLACGKSPARQFQMLVGLFPVYALNTLRALRYRRGKPQYHVNNKKSAKRKRPRPAALAVLPQLVVVGLNLYLPFYAIAAQTAPARVIAANAVVSLLAIWTLWNAIEAALGKHNWAADRHPMQFYGLPEPS